MHGDISNKVIQVLDLKNQTANADTNPMIRNNSITQKNVIILSKQKHQACFGHLSFYVIVENYAIN